MQNLLLLALLFSLKVWPGTIFSGPINTYKELSAKDRYYWITLLHADPVTHKSKIDGEQFFLSPKGKTDPGAEFNSTYETFLNPEIKAGWFHYPAQCVFKARFEFFKKLGLINPLTIIDCKELDDWKKGLNAESLSVVFSSSFPNNPSSMFGHTLIRINQKNKKNDLLDYSVSFSAITDGNDSGLVHAYKGLFGGYKGILEVSKYYTKVNEYNNGESRDLIEYKLKLSDEEVDKFINHVWEIYQTTYADYYFSDENCSSFLADLLEVAMQNHLNLHPRWFYLPSDLMNMIMQNSGLVTEVHGRKSLKKEVEQRLESLDEVQLKKLKKWLSEDGIDENLTEKDVKTIDALTNILDYKRYLKKENFKISDSLKLRKALVKRSNIKISSETLPEIKFTNRPELSHNPHQWHLNLKNEMKHQMLALGIKSGYHDIMGNDLGLDPFSHFNFLGASFIYDQNIKKFSYDEILAVDLISLHPFTFYDPQFSWKAKLIANRIDLATCDLCHKLEGSVAGGFSLPINHFGMANIFAGAFGEVSKQFERGFKLGPFVELSTYFNILEKGKFGFIYLRKMSVVHSFSKDAENEFHIKSSYFINKENDLLLNYKKRKSNEAEIVFVHYF
jgi:hypothetical protein